MNVRSFSRRIMLKLLSALPVVGVLPRTTRARAAESPLPDGSRIDRWHLSQDRVFLGESVWANPMEDWQVRDGWAECQVRSRFRSIHSLAHQIVNPEGSFTTSVRLRKPEGLDADQGAGFRYGIRHGQFDDHRRNCLIHGGGLNAGILRDRLVLGRESVPLTQPFGSGECLLVLSGRPGDGPRYDLELVATTADGEPLGRVTLEGQKRYLTGNLALVSQFEQAGADRGEADRPAPTGERVPGWAFTDWRAQGDALCDKPEQHFGMILWTQYTVSDSRGDEGFVLKLAALTGPLGADDNHQIELFVEQQDGWQSRGTATLDPEGWIATFRVPNWEQSRETRYRVVYCERLLDGGEREHEWGGKIKANPEGRPLRIAGMTCQNDYAFPYAPVAANLLRLDPDLLYFSGDQLYEQHGGFGVVREPADLAILNYLRKFYQHGWAFREAMRDTPTVLITDDHDVFHGNLWGDGGIAMPDKTRGTSSFVGYIQPVEMVNVVHLTHTAHHPDFHNPEPIAQGMSVYYGDMVYGGVGFAILSDRKWKSGPHEVETGGGRADHVNDPDFDTLALDKPGLQLLGERQEAFLAQWANDWRGHTMKIVFSQSPFANLATHHGRHDGYLKADLDSGGWPQTARNRAIDIIRPAKALHISGDQHLASLAQYGVRQQRDSFWSFCTPAIATGYQRWWRPDEVGMEHTNRPAHGREHTGEYLDGLGNKVYVYAVGNPEPQDRGLPPYENAHLKASGFGMVTVDTQARTYQLEAFKFLIDATDGNPDNQFPGWPVTIHQDENIGENRLA